MKKHKYYYKTKFDVSIIKQAYDTYLTLLDSNKDKGSPNTLEVSIGEVDLDYDKVEEFFSDYSKSDYFRFDYISQGNRIWIQNEGSQTTNVLVEFPVRDKIEKIFNIFETNLEKSKIISTSNPIKIFIGHGHNSQWKNLKDHLHDQHGFEVTAYEIGPRAGLSVKEVLEKMLTSSSFALLVLTGEDIHTDGELHARENVIHELGLFQGHLGFTRAIALLEDGVKEFSNILGINQIRFSKDNIRETFGDILATIKREFENND